MLQITENLNSFIAELQRLKPASSKGIYLKDIYLSTSMGPGIELTSLNFETSKTEGAKA